MKTIKIFAMLACLFAFGAALADTRAKAIELEVTKLVRTPSFVERTLDEYGLTGMPRQVLREHMQELYKSNDVIEMFVKEMLNAGADKWDKEKQTEYGKKFGSELLLSYAMKGMPRLTFGDQKTFVKFTLNWLYVASDDDCKKLLVSGGSVSSLDDAFIEMKYYHRMEREELRNYFAIIRKALLAELRGYPSAKNINQQQSKIADEAFENELIKRVEAGLINNEILIAMADMPIASPKLACSAGKKILETMLSMKGFGGELMLTKFTNSLQ